MQNYQQPTLWSTLFAPRRSLFDFSSRTVVHHTVIVQAPQAQETAVQREERQKKELQAFGLKAIFAALIVLPITAYVAAKALIQHNKLSEVNAEFEEARLSVPFPLSNGVDVGYQAFRNAYTDISTVINETKGMIKRQKTSNMLEGAFAISLFVSGVLLLGAGSALYIGAAAASAPVIIAGAGCLLVLSLTAKLFKAIVDHGDKRDTEAAGRIHDAAERANRFLSQTPNFLEQQQQLNAMNFQQYAANLPPQYRYVAVPPHSSAHSSAFQLYNLHTVNHSFV